jgi:hypothetical protein
VRYINPESLKDISDVGLISSKNIT